MERPTCGTCPYWAADGQWEEVAEAGLSLAYAFCQRRPPDLPTAVLVGEVSGPWDGCWPSTAETDWCGEHPRFAEWVEARKAFLQAD